MTITQLRMPSELSSDTKPRDANSEHDGSRDASRLGAPQAEGTSSLVFNAQLYSLAVLALGHPEA